MVNLQLEDSYVSTLDNELLSRAKELWGEDEDLRNRTLQAIREWISLQPNFTCRTDAYYLLSFARGCNYNLEEIKQKINIHLTMRASVPEFFSGWDPTKPEIQAALRIGMQLPVPGYDIHGRKVVVIRNGCFDPQKHKPEDLEKANFMVMECLGKNEERITIGGITIIFDMKGVTMVHMLHKPLSLAKKQVKYIQEGVPFLPAAMIFVHTSPVVSFGISAMMSVFNDNMRRTIQVLGNDLSALHSAVGREFLPTDYGGDGKSVNELAAFWKKEVENEREYLMSQEKYRADYSQRFVKPKASIMNLFW